MQGIAQHVQFQKSHLYYHPDVPLPKIGMFLFSDQVVLYP